MKLAEVLPNPHFRRLAAFLRIPLCFKEWHLAHPQDPADTPIDTLVKNVTDRLNSSTLTTDKERASFLLHFCRLIAAVINLDPRLQCKSGDIYWLMDVLSKDTCDALAIISMLFAYASKPLELLTTVQIAEMRNEPEITWRKRAEGGKIPGAFKVGNRWLLESSVLHAMGVIEDEVNINTEDKLQVLADALGVSIGDLLEIADDTIQIPDSLRLFAKQEHLTPTDIRMLALINYQGKQPDTVPKWQLLYLAIRTTTKPDDH